MSRLGSLIIQDSLPFWWVVLSTPLRWSYYLICRLRYLFYDVGLIKPKHLSGKVISIGNIELGGTGKSPICIAVAEYLLSENYQPAILTHGYHSGLAKQAWCALLNGEFEKSSGNDQDLALDEAMMQSKRLPQVPIVVGRKRFLAATSFQESFARPITHWILDDGLQHRQIYRDKEVVLLDDSLPLGNSYLLPTGRLRDLPSQLKRADLVVFTRATNTNKDSHGQLQTNINKSVQCFFRISGLYSVKEPGKKFPLSESVNLVSAIARNEKLRDNLEEKGVKVVGHLAKSDHYFFHKDELDGFVNSQRILITTEKDYWRQPSLYNALDIEVFLARLEIEFTDPSVLSLLDNSL